MFTVWRLSVLGGAIHFFASGLASLVLCTCRLQAVQLAFDLPFQPVLTTDMGNTSRLYGFAAAPDGRIYISGGFDLVNRLRKINVARLNGDGSVDTSFRYNTPNSLVIPLLVRGDGEVLVTGPQAYPLAWMSAQGVLNPAFPVSMHALNAGAEFSRIEFLPDGKLILAGTFEQVDDRPQKYLARLNADGSLDRSFVPPPVNLYRLTFAMQPDGRMLLAGRFLDADGRPRPRMDFVRLNRDGSFDPTFRPTIETGGIVLSIVVQQDGRIIIGGDFAASGEPFHRNIARLNPDGSLDGSYQSVAAETPVLALIPQPNGKVLARAFIRTGEVAREGYARLNQDGTLDPSFTWPALTPRFRLGTEPQIVPLPTGKILVERVRQPYGAVQSDLVRLNEDGSIDQQFEAELLFNAFIFDVLRQKDGRIIVSGFFDRASGFPRNGLARLFQHSSVDPTFWSPPPLLRTIAIDSQDRIVGATESGAMIRLNADGTRDPTFSAPPGVFTNRVTSIAFQEDGKIVAGSIPLCCPDDRRTNTVLARFEASGQLDPGFVSPFTPQSSVVGVASLEGGNLLVSGALIPLRGSSELRSVARLNADGSIDSDFSATPALSSYSTAMSIRSGGAIVIQVQNQNSADTRNLLIFDHIGSLQRTLASPDASLLAFEDDGKLLFSAGSMLFRLNQDGGFDSYFGIGPDFQGGRIRSISKILKTSEGGYVCAGEFAVGPEQTRRTIVRLLPTPRPVLPIISKIARRTNGFSLQILAPPEYPYRLQAASDLGTLMFNYLSQTVTNLIGTGDWIEVVDHAAATEPIRFYRLVVP